MTSTTTSGDSLNQTGDYLSTRAPAGLPGDCDVAESQETAMPMPVLVERAYQLLRGDSFATADARIGIKNGVTMVGGLLQMTMQEESREAAEQAVRQALALIDSEDATGQIGPHAAPSAAGERIGRAPTDRDALPQHGADAQRGHDLRRGRHPDQLAFALSDVGAVTARDIMAIACARTSRSNSPQPAHEVLAHSTGRRLLTRGAAGVSTRPRCRSMLTSRRSTIAGSSP